MTGKWKMTRPHSFELTIPANATDHLIGPENARITVTEYGDFECPNCKQAAPAVKLLLQHFKGRIRFVYRHFPLEEIHPHALHAAEAAECAGGQGKFWPMHDLLFENQPHLKLPQWRSYAERLDLDLPRYATACTKSSRGLVRQGSPCCGRRYVRIRRPELEGESAN